MFLCLVSEGWATLESEESASLLIAKAVLPRCFLAGDVVFMPRRVVNVKIVECASRRAAAVVLCVHP